MNIVVCGKCKEILVSKYTHDYKTCKCENATMVDGGNDYVRCGGKDMSLVHTFTNMKKAKAYAESK